MIMNGVFDEMKKRPYIKKVLINLSIGISLLLISLHKPQLRYFYA